MMRLCKAVKVAIPKTRARRWIYGASLVLIYIVVLAFGYRVALACLVALAVTRAFDIEREMSELPPAPFIENALPLLFEGDGELPPQHTPHQAETEV